MEKPRIICLMGPTASGKTPLAMQLVQKFPLEIISVDSAMIYRGMNIGTAKPTDAELKLAPHRLLDILDPGAHYSAGQFCRDALIEINDIISKGKTPLLVGGTMLYFRALQKGIATMPTRDEGIRLALAERAAKEGLQALHNALAIVDPVAAQRIHPSDSQRIQRALEVFMLTNQTITSMHEQTANPLADFNVVNIGLSLDRAKLHQRIALRFEQMIEQGFVHEVNKLYKRGDLNSGLPSMRSVGYRQVWQYLAGEIDYDTMQATAIAATRQLAKRQLTWLNKWPELNWFNTESPTLLTEVGQFLYGM